MTAVIFCSIIILQKKTYGRENVMKAVEIDERILDSCLTASEGDYYYVLCQPYDDVGDYWLNHSTIKEFNQGLKILFHKLRQIPKLKKQGGITIRFGGRYKLVDMRWDLTKPLDERYELFY